LEILTANEQDVLLYTFFAVAFLKALNDGLNGVPYSSLFLCKNTKPINWNQ